MRRFAALLLYFIQLVGSGCQEPATRFPDPATSALSSSHSRTGVPATTLDAEDQAALVAWFEAVGGRREGERLGELVVRAARHQLHKPYDRHRQETEAEVLHIDLSQFQCVSFVESSLAVARCVWRRQPTGECFVAEVEASRYRGGRLDGYASRLHYFPDWMADNEERGRVAWATADLGGIVRKHEFTFMSAHPELYPTLSAPAVRAQIATREAELSDRDWVILERDRVSSAQPQLQNGDIVALVSDRKPGLLVGHTGFVDMSASGVPRLLHASSHHQRVLLTARGVASYVQRRPDRVGIMVARPLPPP
jgi:hypothetical protein